MKLEDALFNWLQISLVAKARPDDQAAKETERFFIEILEEDHDISDVKLEKNDDAKYSIHYIQAGDSQFIRFDKTAADQLLADIQAEPKYNQQ